MTKTFTRNDVMRFLYGEMNPTEADEFRSCLDQPELKEIYLEQLVIMQQLDAVMISPSDKVINSIIEYSRAQKHTEKV